MRTISCISCQHESPRYLEAPVAFGCPHCGRIMTRADKESSWQVAQPLPKRAYYVKPGWMRPGAQLNFEDKIYTIFNIMVYHSNWEEWDNEDKTWEHGVCDNEEWYAVAEDGSELCLEIDDGLHYIRQEIPRPEPAIFQRFKSWDVSAIERGDFRLSGLEGEDDEPLDRRDYRYMVLDENGDLYGEWLTDDFEGSACFYQYLYVSATELERMRIRDNSEIENYEAQLPHQTFYRNVLSIAALCFLGFWLGSMSMQGIAVIRKQINFSAYRMDDSLQMIPQSLGVFHLKPQQVYNVQLKCSLPENAAAGFDLEFVDTRTGAVVNSFGCEFAIETGYDEGKWTESTLTDDFLFRSEEGGEFEAIILPAPTSYSDMPRSGGNLNFQVTPMTLSRYFLFILILLIGALLIVQWRLENTHIVLNHGNDSWMHNMRDAINKNSNN